EPRTARHRHFDRS
ncbi:hypothetical protein ACMD2_20584, partial [Ananas comosus]